MGITNTDFTLFPDLLAIIQADLRADTRAETNAGERYFITTNDLGEGVLMNNGLYANIVTSGGGYFFPSGGIQGERITSGQTGVLFSAPEATGVVYKITSLACSASVAQAGISLIVNGVTIEDEKQLFDITPTAGSTSPSFSVSETIGNVSGGLRVYKNIECTSFSVVKNAGNTPQSIDIIYQIGEII